MSNFNQLDVTCPKCDEAFEGMIWTSIQTQQDPELRDLMLGGELNLLSCPFCAHIFFYEHFLLYHDPDNELLAYVYPESEKTREAELQTLSKRGFVEALEVFKKKKKITYDPILFFGLEELVETVHREDEQNEQVDVAEWVCREQSIPIYAIPLSLARQRNLPRLLPMGKKEAGPTRENVLKGLEKLLAANPVLESYRKLEGVIQADPQWQFQRVSDKG